ncbi:hypothetical protein ELH84_22005 [Rhizobium ruizarguesonis]|nr:hypothetical protein ELH84_22005 [Rhizobium ruizarguesonis]
MAISPWSAAPSRPASNFRASRWRRPIGSPALEHDAEKCERFSDDIMLYLYNLEQHSDVRPTGPKIILF